MLVIWILVLKTTEQNKQQTVLEVEPQVVTENAERHFDDSSHKVHDEQAYQALSAHQNPTINMDEGRNGKKKFDGNSLPSITICCLI